MIVHGGGPQATELQKQLGLETKQVAGRRVTDAATLDVMKMVVAGKLNVDLCAALAAAGVAAGRPARRVGPASCARRAARRRSTPAPAPSRSTSASSATSSASTSSCSRLLWAAGYVPVIACLGADAEGGVYNINADMVGNQLAAALERRAPVPRDVDARRAARRQRSGVAHRRS